MHTPVRLPAIRQHLQRLGARAERSLPAALMRRFIETDLMTQAASLSFYALLSLAPLLILLLWLTASLYPPAQQSLLDQIGQLAGSDAAAVATTVIRNADARPDLGSLAGLWSTALLLVGATVVFAQLQGALNLIFRTDAQRLNGLVAWLKKRVFSLGVVLAIGFLLIVSMIATTALQVAFARLPSLLPVLGYTSPPMLYALAFAFFYHYLPDRRVAWKQAFLGGVITALLFAGGRYLIGLYLAEAAPGSAYGSMGALVLMLVWIYYASVVFFAGALITAVIDERRVREVSGEE
ncbi:YihY/virulence factor BrkB family protein [Pseudoxanthomonas mexicana]|uniref:YihY/virulence factor BrkB family protein n=1 Tax=Pseudoxanthomonas mexicana TaxID=128785 RepID=UPI003CCFEA19